MTTSTTSLTLDSDPAKVGDLQSQLSALCQDAGLDSLATFKLTYVVVEVVNNSIKHGYRGEPGHPIRVHWCCDDDGVAVAIGDRGPPIPAGFLDAPMPSPEDVSGRGGPSIREWTDSARYDRIGDENVFNLMWRR
jgi:anti-sigma regulatory factor (Ser/Thr protein kinase)